MKKLSHALRLLLFVTLLASAMLLASCFGNPEETGPATTDPVTTEAATTTAPATTAPSATTPSVTTYRDFDTATPEEVGLSSADIEAVIDGLIEKDMEMHSVLVIRHGKIVAEHYIAPYYDQNSLQRMYSSSKTFTSMAVGLLASTGEISLDDRVVEYFPEYNPESAAWMGDEVDRRVLDATIEDLLRMSSPYNATSYRMSIDQDWVDTFFNTPTWLERFLKEPGETWYYDTSASYILGVIVERVTGDDFLTYLINNAMYKTNFSPNAWCVKAPEGNAWGGSGVQCTTRDLARLALVALNGGKWYGEQVLPADYIAAATSWQISNGDPATTPYTYKGHGYGYQVWMTTTGFVFTGMGDQLAICVPDQDLLFVCTADNQASSYIGNQNTRQEIFDLVEEHLIAKASDNALPANPEALASLQAKMESMTLPVQKGELTSSIACNGVTYTTADAASISSFRLDFSNDGQGTLTYQTVRDGETVEKKIFFGLGKNVEFTLDEPGYSGDTINTPNGRGYRSVGSAAWVDENTLAVYVQVIDEYLGKMRLTFDFEADGSVKLTGRKIAEEFLNEYAMVNVTYTPAE